MKIGIILETNDPEKAWNAIRFANTALTKQHEVRLFLMGAGVEAESITHAKYNVKEQLHTFIDKKALYWPAVAAYRDAIRQSLPPAPFPPCWTASMSLNGQIK